MHSAAALSPQPHRACGACGATGNTVCHQQRFIVPDGYPLPSEYNVAVCHRCGFVYADPAATQRDYDRFYCEWSKYDDSATATGSGLSVYDAARLALTASDIARALPSRAASDPRRRLRHGWPAHCPARPRIHGRRRARSFSPLRRRVPQSWF